MTKTYPIIYINGNGVVVDKEAKLQYHDYYEVDGRVERYDSSTDWTHLDSPKVIATIADYRIEGVAMVKVIEETAESFADKHTKQVVSSRVKPSSIAHLGLYLGYETGKAAQSKGTFTEKDMRNIALAANNGFFDEDGYTCSPEKWLANYFSKTKTKPLPISVTLSHLPSIEGWILQIDQPDEHGGIIHNAIFHYEGIG